MNSLPNFASFFQALWGYDPFPWQDRLAARLSSHPWPGCLALPTGTGKTTALDIAVYHLATQAHLSVTQRTAPVRIVFAVNRRIVVDEAYERAKTIAAKLNVACDYRAESYEGDERFRLSDAQKATLRPVAQALQNLSGLNNGPALEAYPLRGATFTDHSWARTPTQPLILTTTLDQLGSRLLFRGYGVSPFARPVHAALLSNDALLLLDEAHTAKAFAQTLHAIGQFREAADEPVITPLTTVQLTATPPRDLEEKPFDLDETDHAHEVIRRRLHASKQTRLIPEIEGAKGANRHTKLAATADAITREWLADPEGPRRILIVVNRVATAETLQSRLTKKKLSAEVELLTGRLRPLDRDRVIRKLNDTYQLKDTSPSPDVPKLVVVATQTVEVGADFDFDALISELAPLDSLRQRFGRLNRTGREIEAPGAILAPQEALDSNKPDPLYGECLPKVWQWLHDHAGDDKQVDFGLAALGQILPQGEGLAPLLAPTPDAPLLLPPHLDLLCQTSPEPHVSPDPSLYIHGPGRDFAEVSLVLRADLEQSTDPLALLNTIPPVSTEAASIPLALAAQWLRDPEKASKSTTDSDGPQNIEAKQQDGQLQVSTAYLYRAGEALPLTKPSELAPGDILVLPTQTSSDHLAKLLPLSDERTESDDSFHWHLDHFEPASILASDRLALRFHRPMRDYLLTLLSEDQRGPLLDLTNPLLSADEEEDRWTFRESDWRDAIPLIADHLARNLPENHPLKEVWSYAAWIDQDPSRPRLKDDWNVGPLAGETNVGVLLANRTRLGATPWPVDPDDLGRQGNQHTKPELLEDHSIRVETRAATNAAGLAGLLRDAVTTAARWHDLGKLDPRFQGLLYGCALWAVPSQAKPLAKSGRRNHALEKYYRGLAELPKGFRHELISALLADQTVSHRDHPEFDLILHLIASHHGRCRAMAPVVPDPQPEPIDVPMEGNPILFPGVDAPLAHIGSGVADRFWKLTRRFGWWGLPYLECLLRLADQYESANPSAK